MTERKAWKLIAAQGGACTGISCAECPIGTENGNALTCRTKRRVSGPGHSYSASQVLAQRLKDAHVWLAEHPKQESNPLTESLLAECCQAFGWQGGTRRMVLDGIKYLRQGLEATTQQYLTEKHVREVLALEVEALKAELENYKVTQEVYKALFSDLEASTQLLDRLGKDLEALAKGTCSGNVPRLVQKGPRNERLQATADASRNRHTA